MPKQTFSVTADVEQVIITQDACSIVVPLEQVPHLIQALAQSLIGAVRARMDRETLLSLNLFPSPRPGDENK